MVITEEKEMEEIMVFLKRQQQAPLNFMDVEDYIKQHNHIYYCEAIVDSRGNVADAVPSHVEGLIKFTGESRNVLYDKIDIYDSVVDWLLGYTGCVCIWYEFRMYNGVLTMEQVHTINRLKESDIIE